MKPTKSLVPLALLVLSCSGESGSPNAQGGASSLSGATSVAAGDGGTAAGGDAAGGIAGAFTSGAANGGSDSSEAGASFGGSAGSTGSAGSSASAGSGGAAGGNGSAGSAGSGAELKRVLVYNRVDINPDTNALRGHTGGGADEQLLQALGTEHGFSVVITDKGSEFTTANLAGFDVVAFASPDYTSQEFSAANRAALEGFVRKGGGWVGWHYALWVEKGWPFMAVLGGGVSARGHVGVEQTTTYTVTAPTHPIAKGLLAMFDVKDDFLALDGGSPADDPSVTILATAALTAVPGGSGHPVIWAHDIDKGRAFYSMLGHGAADFTTPGAKVLMWNALRWVSRTNP